MEPSHNIADLRKVYQLESLLESEAESDPIKQFEKWWLQAIEAKIDEPNAMVLATSDAANKPSARIVLLKGLHDGGFIFFTNYQSRKGQSIDENPQVSLLFFWKEMERQVRIEGRIAKVSDEESDKYFQSRPRGSRIGAWTSPQSEVIENREYLQDRYEQMNARFQSEDIPRPQNWGGYIVMPDAIEFWQGRPSRLHDRLQYTIANDQWIMQRLAP